jgi:hypothetical protein
MRGETVNIPQSKEKRSDVESNYTAPSNSFAHNLPSSFRLLLGDVVVVGLVDVEGGDKKRLHNVKVQDLQFF